MSADPPPADDPADLGRRVADLEAQLDRYRAALAGGHVGVWDTDLRTGALTWDPAVGHLHGLPPGASPGTRDAFYELVHPDDRDRVRAAAQQAIDGHGAYAAEFRVRCPDGAVRWLAAAGQVLRDADGRPVRLTGATTDVTARHAAEDRLRASIQEKEALLKEVHHRVKNNLQVVSSLLHLQSAQLADPGARAALKDSQARIRSIALVHEGIYRSADFGRLDLGRHLGEVVTHLLRTHGTDPAVIRTEVRAAGVEIDLDRAVSCSLLVHELVSNALKHAFPDGRAGSVTVTVDPAPPGRLTLAVADDGVGLPPGLDHRKTATLGLQLVCSLAQQVGGTIDLGRSAGTAFRVTFPAPRPSPGGP